MRFKISDWYLCGNSEGAIMKTYEITIIQSNGKIRTEHIEACTPEMAVRSLVCWYSVGTRFYVDGKSFEIIRTSDKISGYTDLSEVQT